MTNAASTCLLMSRRTTLNTLIGRVVNYSSSKTWCLRKQQVSLEWIKFCMHTKVQALCRKGIFLQFEKSFQNIEHECRLSSRTGADYPRARNSLERHNINTNKIFTFNQLLSVNEFLRAILVWLSSESKSCRNLRVSSLMEYAAGMRAKMISNCSKKSDAQH